MSEQLDNTSDFRPDSRWGDRALENAGPLLLAADGGYGLYEAARSLSKEAVTPGLVIAGVVALGAVQLISDAHKRMTNARSIGTNS